MSGFFSDSGRRRHYPNKDMGNRHYKKRGLMGMLKGFGSFSGSSYSRGYSDIGTGFPPLGKERMICSKCGASVPAGSKFCLSCGEKMESGESFCGNCGASVPAGARFCMKCGAPVRK